MLIGVGIWRAHCLLFDEGQPGDKGPSSTMQARLLWLSGLEVSVRGGG